MATLPPGTLPQLLEELIRAGHDHGHSHSHVASTGADPLALWVAGASIGVKEWLFRASISLLPRETNYANTCSQKNRARDKLDCPARKCTPSLAPFSLRKTAFCGVICFIWRDVFL